MSYEEMYMFQHRKKAQMFENLKVYAIKALEVIQNIFSNMKAKMVFENIK